MKDHVKTIWFIFWIASLIFGAIAASGVIHAETWQKLAMALVNVFSTVSTFLAAQWQKPEDREGGGGGKKSEAEAPTSLSQDVANAAKIGALLVLIPFLSACVCFKPASPEYNSKKCVVARQSVDCAKGSVIGFITAVGPALALAILNGADIDLAKIAEQAEKGAIGNGLCLLAALEADFVKPAASGGAPRLAAAREKSHSALADLAHKLYGPGPVDIKVPVSGGEAVALVSVR